ncbi:MAG: gliding motility-associated C-terminal domain-containing protein, partial [Saprospiraceae bacterium]|nr:gliding motility-associated C-terminal domain-containing protein [Saprospiraceae bacterium]
GQWKLLVKDDGNGVNGTLLDWSITFEPSYEINYAWTPAANVSCADCPVTQVMSNQSQVYVVEATDSYGCKTQDSVRVGLDLLDIVASVTDSISCFGETDGSLAVSLGGSSSAVNYLWSTGQTTTTVDNLTAGTYTVSISNVSGCSTTLNVVLPEPEALLSDVTANDLTCFGTPTGSIISQITGGTLPYTYLWNNGATTADLTDIAAGTYSVTVSDKYGCSSVNSAAITQPQELVASVTPSAAACNGGSTGSAIVSVAGGVGPYDFKWNDPAGQTTQVAVNLPTGTYQVTVFDANGCTLVRTANISQPPALQLNAIPQSVSCNGGNNGAISMQINGGVLPYQYQWNTGATTANLTGQLAGTYTVTVTDANLCTQTRTETIIEPAVIVLWPDENPVKCYDGNTGSITVSTTGGTGNFNFIWSGPNGYTGTGDEIGQLYAGTYTTTVTDANACTSSVEVTVSQPAAPLRVPLPEVSDTICFGNSDGVAVATPTGGTAPYQYLWSNGQTEATATALATTFYNITVTDANECTTVGFTFIDQRQVMFSFAESTPPKCHDGADGTATVSAVFYGAVSQDLGQFSYTWNTTPSQTALVATGLNASQSYEVTVTDVSLGCSSTQTVTVGNRFALSAETFGIEPVKCYGDSTGRAAIQASGGTPPYSWFWSPGPDVQTDSIATGLPAGNFKVTVTDDAGCTAVKTVLIQQPEKLQNTLSQTEVNCYGENSGKAKANVSGGVSPYQYIWWNGRQTPEIDQLAAGTIGVTVTDANGCYRSDTIVVRQPEAPMSGQAEITPIRCSGDRDGRITMQVEGGTPPYRYGLNNSNLNGSTVQIGLKAGTYVPRIVDQRGCELILDTVLLEAPEPFTVDLGPDITIDLGQDTMLEAQVSANALEPLSFRWSSDDLKWLSCGDCFNPTVEGLDFTRLFNVVVTDSLGCVAEDAIRLIVDKPRRVHVPTGFSPNGDINNDRLLVHGQSSAMALSFQVFDRWGELMFEANNFQLNDVNTGWDGTFRGKDCDPGVYIWLLEVQYQDGVKEILKGNTTLIR